MRVFSSFFFFLFTIELYALWSGLVSVYKSHVKMEWTGLGLLEQCSFISSRQCSWIEFGGWLSSTYISLAFFAKWRPKYSLIFTRIKLVFFSVVVGVVVMYLSMRFHLKRRNGKKHKNKSMNRSETRLFIQENIRFLWITQWERERDKE